MFIFNVRNFHSRRIWYEKPAPKTGARKWSPVSGACVMGISENNENVKPADSQHKRHLHYVISYYANAHIEMTHTVQ